MVIGVNQAGYQEILGVSEGSKENEASWLPKVATMLKAIHAQEDRQAATEEIRTSGSMSGTWKRSHGSE